MRIKRTIKSKITPCLALILSGGLFGCSTIAHRSVTPVTPEQNTANALSTLHVGMTIGDADQHLGRYGAMRAFTVSSAMRHSYHYVFIPDMNDVTLQFDEHDKLASWKSTGNDIDQTTTKQISAILIECQKIKPGMTRAELLKVFTTEGGLSTATHRTFVRRLCPYVKIDVDFTLADPKQKAVEERPTDTISKISKPYLEWSIID